MNFGVYGKRYLAARFLYVSIAVVWYLLTILGRFYGDRVVVLCCHGIIAEQRGRSRGAVS
jgi:hypothetical protein